MHKRRIRQVHRKLNGFVPLIGLLIIAAAVIAAGAGSFFAVKFAQMAKEQAAQLPANQQITDQTSAAADTLNWQTYRNEKYGFEFMYPSSFQIFQNELGV